MTNGDGWDFPAVHARAVQRQVHSQNSTFSERSSGQELRSGSRRLPIGIFQPALLE